MLEVEAMGGGNEANETWVSLLMDPRGSVSPIRRHLSSRHDLDRSPFVSKQNENCHRRSVHHTIWPVKLSSRLLRLGCLFAMPD